MAPLAGTGRTLPRCCNKRFYYCFNCVSATLFVVQFISVFVSIQPSAPVYYMLVRTWLVLPHIKGWRKHHTMRQHNIFQLVNYRIRISLHRLNLTQQWISLLHPLPLSLTPPTLSPRLPFPLTQKMAVLAALVALSRKLDGLVVCRKIHAP